jgi:hypothetical protein
MHGTGARDGLQSDGALLLECLGVGAEDQLGSLGGKAGDTRNGGVLMVELGVVSEDLISL